MFKKHADAINWLMYEMPKTTKGVFKDGESLKRGQYLMEKLGSPHLKLKAIHVSGTSGKGGVTSYAASLLHQQGFKVGHNLSPHAKTINERIQINNQPISDDELLNLINQIKPVIDEMGQSDIGRPSYFEAVTTMAMLHFYQQNVDYAVIEVGMGGTFDTTNLINPAGKVCIINKIAKDHTKVLGDNLVDIAKHKAGIIKSKNTVIALKQSEDINQVFIDKASFENANLNLIDGDEINLSSISLDGTDFWFNTKKYRLKMIGRHNAINFILALEAVHYLAKKDAWTFDENKTDIAENLILPFRFEVNELFAKTFIFDGAHNLDKISAFISAFSQLKLSKNDVDLVFGYSRTDDIKDVAELLAKHFSTIIVTPFNFASADLKNQALDFNTINSAFENFGIQLIEAGDVNSAVRILTKSTKKYVVVLGSFYLCDQVYRELLA